MIHWGLLYHLDDWKRDLNTALRHARRLSLESEVMDSPNPTDEVKINEYWDTGAKNGRGTRMTAAAVELVFAERDIAFHRYDDSDLNAAYHCYDWLDGTWPGRTGDGLRRFWMTRI